MTSEERAWKGVTGGSAFGQKAMKILLSIVPVRAGYLILVFVVPFYMLFARKRYLAIYRYFRKHHHYTPLRSFCKTFRNHYLFGQMMFDRFAVYAGQKKFSVDNPDNDLFLEMVYAQHGCIIASSHVGNPELCGYLLSQQTKRINSLIFGGEAAEVQKNRAKTLIENNVRLIPVMGDMSHIYLLNEALTNGEMVSMPCDRAFGSAKTVECDFMNGKADFPIGAFVLALQYDVPVIALFVVKQSASHYMIHVVRVPAPPIGNSAVNNNPAGNFSVSNDLAGATPAHPPSAGSKREQANRMACSFAGILEGIVRKYPEQWFNFYDFWKPCEKK